MATTAPSAAPPPRHPIHTERGQGVIGIGVSILAAIVGLIVLAWLVLFVTKGRFLKHRFESMASSSAGRSVIVPGDFQLYFAPFKLKFVADGLTVKNPSWAPKPLFWHSEHLEALVEPLSLIFGSQYKIDWIELTNAAADLEWEKAGAAQRRNTWTFGAQSQGGKPLNMPLIRRAQISGTTVRYVDPLMFLSTDIKIGTVQATNTRVDQNIAFSGDGTLRNIGFTMNGQVMQPNAAVAGGPLDFQLHGRSRATIMDVTGKLPGVTQVDGGRFKVKVRGDNIARLFDFIGVAVPDTRAYRITSDLLKDGNDWKFTHMAGIYGQSDIGGSMTVTPAQTTKDKLKLVADLASRKVDIIDIGPFIGYDPNALATKSVTAAATTQGGAPGRILPDAPLRIDALKAFDAHVTYKVTTIRAPHVPVSNVALTLDLDNLLLKLSPLTFDMAGGHVTSDISINARGKPVETAYDIRLSPTPMGKLLAGWGLEKSGTTGVIKARIKMTGEGDTVRSSLASSDGRIAIILPQGTFWMQYAQLSEFDVGTFLQKLLQKQGKEPIQVNCGLIGFTVRDGVASADPILIDTTKNVMLGKGNFSFKDESINIMFRADAKKISLFSAQSPFGIKGHFSAPSFQIITPQLLERGGAAALLGIAAGPAALLAFVDPGDAKAAACGPVLEGARAVAQRTTKGKPRDDVGKGNPNPKKK